METAWQDVRYGLRVLRKNVGFTVTALIALMLGIASTTVIASVINGVLLRPLPYPDAERIVAIAQSDRATGARRDAVSPANFVDWLKQSDVFVVMAASRGWQGTLNKGDAPERLRVTMTSASLFQVFAVNPLLGRTLQPADEQPGRANVCVLTHELWERTFGGDPDIIGREIRFDGQPRTVVGVMPAGFCPDNYAELWVPSPFGVPTHALRPNQDPRELRDSNFLDAYARLKPGVTLSGAQTQMSAIMARLEKAYPNEDKGEDVLVIPLHEDEVSGLRPALLMLAGSVGLLLLIGCANVANLQLARATGRAREVSIRAALGADRKRLLRQFLTESILLSSLGGLLGLVLAAWTMPILIAMAPPILREFNQISIDRGVLAFSAGLSLFTGVLFGIAPAFQGSAAHPLNSLGEGDRGNTSGRTRTRSILVPTEVALTVVLLIAAGLLIKSFSILMRVDPGFRPQGLLVFDIALPPGTEDVRNLNFYQQVVERLRSLPAVGGVGAVSRLPFSGGNSARSFKLQGDDKTYEADIRISTPDYFRTMGIPLVRGRLFNQQDTPSSTRVCLINEVGARMLFGGGDPIGRHVVDFDRDHQALQIVGVIGNLRHLGLDSEPRPEIYLPLGQGAWPRMFVAVRARAGDPLALLPSVQQVIWSVDRGVALGSVRTMEDTIARSLLKRKFSMTLLSIFASVGVALAGIGLYGVMSYSVSQRTRELGIRIALGAQRSDVLRLVVREGMFLAGVGVVVGITSSLGLTRVLASLLFGVRATDLSTFAIVSMLLLAVALLACWLPARRATAVDPMVALRRE